ncbi:hypothetical protein C8R45DRAFT_61097 [Mycena sanguinolenta]|nr:hypothetical protein C8R45DRAFT_61097 [Mycena sanguinolenta]
MTEVTIYVLLSLAILVQRSACLSFVAESSGSGFPIPTIVGGGFDGANGIDSVPITLTSSGISFSSAPTFIPVDGQGVNADGGLGTVTGASYSLVDTTPFGGGDTTSLSQLVLTGTQTFSADTLFLAGNTQTSASATIATTVTIIASSQNPSTPPDSPASTGISSSTGSESLPQPLSTWSTSSQLTVTSNFTSPDSPASIGISSSSTGSESLPQPLSTSSQLTITSNFGNDVHISATLSPSTSIFTTTTYSVFTTDGHTATTAIPVLKTSVTLVPVPTSSSTQTASSSPAQTASSRPSSGPSTSEAIGIALGGVAIFLSLILCYIIKRRRNLRRRAFLRLGEEI